MFKFSDELGHLLDVIGGAGENGLLDVQSGTIFKKGFLILGRVIFNAQALLGRVVDNLVVHVGDVHDVTHGESALQQKAPQNVYRHKGAKVADVTVVVNRGSTGVHANFIALQRVELFDLAGQRVVEA